MILLVAESGQQEVITGVTRIEDVSRPGGSLTKIEVFTGDDSHGTIESNKTTVEILPNP